MLIALFWLGLIVAFLVGYATAVAFRDARHNRALYDSQLLDGGKLRRKPSYITGHLATIYHKETGAVPAGLREWN